jgi:hypothetical protein
VRGRQQYELLEPPATHTSLPLQEPQSRARPQPSPPGTLPQATFASPQVRGLQQLPPTHSWPEPLQLPQFRTPPQPSLACPQCTPMPSQLRGWHSSHTLAVPAPAQVLPPVQPPTQLSVPPQPSAMVPHSAAGFKSVQLVAGVQQVYGPSTHTSPLLQLPQSTV